MATSLKRLKKNERLINQALPYVYQSWQFCDR